MDENWTKKRIFSWLVRGKRPRHPRASGRTRVGVMEPAPEPGSPLAGDLPPSGDGGGDSGSGSDQPSISAPPPTLPEQPFPGAAVDSEGGWQCGAAHYDLGERVGKGAFAEVFAARCRSGPRTGTRVAVKVGAW